MNRSNPRLRAGAWYIGIAMYAAAVCVWLLIGLAAALTAHAAPLHSWASSASSGGRGSGWISTGRGLIAGAALSYPVTGIVLDYAFSAANLLIAVALLRRDRRDPAVRLLVIGLVGTAGAFNLQSHTAADVVNAGFGIQIDAWHAALLHGVGGLAYIVALLLYPTGTLPWDVGRGRAGKALAVVGVAAIAGLLGTATARYPHTFGFVLFFGLLIPLGVGAAQWGRLSRSATPQLREQSRILLWALSACLAATVVLAAIAVTTRALDTPGLALQTPGVTARTPGMSGSLPGLGGFGSQAVAFWIFRVVAAAVPCAVLVGVARFRLWTVELLLNRSLIYGALAAAIGAVYVFGVARVDALFGLDSDWLAPPQVAAAGLVALAFHPVRLRLESWTDRLVYGRRIAPYDVLAQVSALSATSAGSTEALVALARIAAQGLRTGYAVVHLDLADGTRKSYRWPPDAPAAEHDIPVAYRGSPVGALGLPAQAGRKPRAGRGTLLDHLPRAAGVVLHNAGLSIELERRLRATELRAAEIRASRWRIVAAQDGERRELERDLHDGAQPGLTAVRFALGLAAHLVPSGKPQARETLIRLRDQIDEASVNLRQTLRGLAPAALGEHGIAQALRELAESLGVDAELRLGGEQRPARFAPDIEAAVYFCCAEALQNAAKHCPDATVSATLETDRAAGVLRFTVADDGPGFDASASTGSGMQNMADRIAAAGGTLKIESTPGTGTTVTGTVPTATAAAQSSSGPGDGPPLSPSPASPREVDAAITPGS